ncbi:MAG: para-nitrobenzyl esterase [Actinomycetota bacterium]|nr:para-nitrobenzyl esterase [Actinomycetota bacterium]
MRPTVELSSGRLSGSAEGPLCVFRGIPYARPPVGALRFGAPHPPKPWAGVREATHFGPAAAQSAIDVEYVPGFSLWEGIGATSEDCLTVNVWTPGLSGRRPVLVWIHGGAFLKGAGSQALYDGAALARRGDVVVVTANYRLGVFGFLALDDDRCVANAGVLDQVAVLEWVAEHAAAFGGDPGNVTVMGESAGAISVAAMMTSPRARGRFHRAVAQSGAGRRLPTADGAGELTDRLLARLGLGPSPVEELLALPTERLLSAQVAVSVDVRRDDIGAGFQPWTGGDVLPTQPLDGLAAGLAAGVPFLAGTNVHEMNLWRVLEPGLRELDEDGLAVRVQRLVGEAAGDLVAVYRAARPSAAPAELWSAIWSDREFRIPSLRATEAQSARAADTFSYLFTWPSPAPGIGSCHALELPFVFGTLDSKGADAFAGSGPSAEALATTVQDAWLSFARSGNPGWPAYDQSTRSTMILGERSGLADDPMSAERLTWDGLPTA